MVGGSILTDIGFYFSRFHKSSIIRTFSISYSGLLSISVHYDFLSQIFHCTHSVIECWKNTWKKIWKELWLRTIIIEKFTRSNCILLISTGQVVTKKNHTLRWKSLDCLNGYLLEFAKIISLFTMKFLFWYLFENISSVVFSNCIAKLYTCLVRNDIIADYQSMVHACASLSKFPPRVLMTKREIWILFDGHIFMDGEFLWIDSM